MSKISVLLLISTALDLNVLNHSPRLQRYHFFSLTAMDYLGNTSSGPCGEALRNALERKIGHVGAHYLLAHLGSAFDRYPVEFLSALVDVQTLHPQLKIGLDKGLGYAMQVLEVSGLPGPEVDSLVARLSLYGSAFAGDEDTQTLVACLR